MDLLSVVGQCDNGYACVYQNNLSWSSPTTPLPAEAHPRIVFENLFGEEGGTADRRAALQEAGQPARFGDRRAHPPAKHARARRSQPRQPVSGVGPRRRTAHSAGRGRRRRESAAGSRSPARRSGGLCRPRPADVRPAAAGAAGRHHPRRSRSNWPAKPATGPIPRSASPIRIIR